MNSVLQAALVAVTVLWLLFCIWTVRRLGRMDAHRFKSMTFGFGVWLPGLSLWIAATMITAYVLVTHPGPGSIVLWTAGTAIYAFPICLWGGYALCLTIDAIFPGRDSAGR